MTRVRTSLEEKLRELCFHCSKSKYFKNRAAPEASDTEKLMKKKKKRRRKKKKRKLTLQSGDSFLKKTIRSLGGFLFGTALSSVYALIVICATTYNIWYCLVSSLSLGLFVGLGMGLSVRIRSIVLLALPLLFSKQGKNFLLFMAFSTAVQGPLMNIFDNFGKAAKSIACGAELAMNQTLELAERVKQPLVVALKKIKLIAQRAKAVADRVRKFFQSIMDAVRHIARSLQNIFHWLTHIGDICNEALGSPYRKCTRIFDDARNRCLKIMTILFFLCYIVDLFKFLCGLANILLLFCIIPAYVGRYLKEKVAEPIHLAIERVKREFEFNISIIHEYDVQLNSTKPVANIAFDIMEEINERINPIREAIGLFGYLSTIFIIFMYIQWTMFMTLKEKHEYTWNITNVIRHSLVVTFILVVDYIVFWVLDMIRYYLHGEVIARAPVLVSISVTGKGYTSDMYRDVVSSFDVLQKANISVLSKKCTILPSEPDYSSYITIGVLYGVCFMIVIFGNYIVRLRRIICSSYFPSRERERICFLYNQILTRRTTLRKSLLRAIKKNSADEGHTSILLVLAARIRCFAWLASWFGMRQKHCMGCGKIGEMEDTFSFVTCITPGCKGFYCSQCYEQLRNVCSICMGPLTFDCSQEEEIDSSDEETVKLWIKAMKAIKHKEIKEKKRMRKILKQKIKEALRKQVDAGVEFPEHILQKLNEADRPDTNSDTSSDISFEAKLPCKTVTYDTTYQDKSRSSGGSSAETFDVKLYFEKWSKSNMVTIEQLERFIARASGGSMVEDSADTAKEGGQLRAHIQPVEARKQWGSSGGQRGPDPF
nr:PREDICTED: DC-STAMP domain-containing protein 2 [Latimeria chalumnae]|eukprot:XP_014347569.1 PREDICTED: DC-STAMP domain-containing protein 2 [Latimeria chalumnae]